MSLAAPLCVPVEISRGVRFFRLAREVSHDGLVFDALPDELEGPIELTFCLPGDRRPIRCRGRFDRRWARQIALTELDEDGHARIEAYVQERLGISA